MTDGTSCTAIGDGALTTNTTYTLTCTAFNGTTVTDEATVNIIPVFEET